MHTVEALERCLSVAEELGYQIRQEWLDGAGGGACEFAGRKWLFVDLSLSAVDQLQQVADSLAADPAIDRVTLPPPLKRLFVRRQAA